MYAPKRSCSNASNDRIEPLPMRSLAAKDQALLDSTVIIKDLSLNEDLGYFVTKCAHGDPCANDVHGLHYHTKGVTQ